MIGSKEIDIFAKSANIAMKVLLLIKIANCQMHHKKNSNKFCSKPPASEFAKFGKKEKCKNIIVTTFSNKVHLRPGMRKLEADVSYWKWKRSQQKNYSFRFLLV